VRFGVVGHTEWVEFAVVPHVPVAGEILHAGEWFHRPGGGGAVAAVQLRRLVGQALFLTALGCDAEGERARTELRGRWDVDVHAATRDAPQRRAFTHLDAGAERTITVIGERLVPHGDDDLPWERLAACDGVYFTGGDAEALRRTRAAKLVVATPRAGPSLAEAGVPVDVLVASAGDPSEQPPVIDPPPGLVVLTEGAAGGRWVAADGSTGRWDAVPPPARPVDSYGCGDTFAAALTLTLGRGDRLADALAFAARAASHCLAGRGPYGHSLPAA
jgi:ribokinase